MEDYRDEEESGHLCTPHHNAALHKSSGHVRMTDADVTTDWGDRMGYTVRLALCLSLVRSIPERSLQLMCLLGGGTLTPSTGAAPRWHSGSGVTDTAQFTTQLKSLTL